MSDAPPIKDSANNPPTARMILAEVASPGIARGSAVVCGCAEDTPIARHVIEESEGSIEIERLDAAIAKAEKGMLELRQRIGRDRGEMAGNPAFAELLLGLGFRSLSVNPSEILEIKNMIRGTEIQEAEALARQVLTLSTSQEIKVCMRDRNTHREAQN